MFNLSEEISRLRLEISHLKEQNKHIQQHISPIYVINNNNSAYNKTVQRGKHLKQQQYINYSNSNNSHMYITQSLPNQKHLNTTTKRNAFPIQKGMFSMKKVKHASSSNRTTPLTFNNNNNNINNNNNSSLLSQGLQFLDDNESISINDNSSSIKASVSSINLNKYKIFPSSTPISNMNTTNVKVKTTSSISTSNKHISPSTAVATTTTTMIEHTAHFDNKPRFIKESRRMLIEYTKTMKHITHETSLTNVLSFLKLNPIILQQKPQQQQHQQPQINMNNVISDVNYNNDNVKTTMLNYLSVPRLMSLIREDDEREAFIFLLSPTFSSFSDGKERYLFRWVDLKERLIKGGFDICNVFSCELKDEEGNVFKVEVTVGVHEKRVYEIEASTKEMCFNCF